MTNETVKPFMGEIRMFAGDFAPKGWMLCNGATLGLSKYAALGDSLLHYKYGGIEHVKFCLPDLRGRAPLNQGQGKGLKNYPIGIREGYEKVRLTSNQIKHRHTFRGAKKEGNALSPQGRSTANLRYDEQADKHDYFFKQPADDELVALSDGTIRLAGEEKPEPHSNLMPYKVVNFIIATEGAYPSEREEADVSDAGYMGEIRLFPYTRPPKGWMFCDGATLSQMQYTALFSIIGDWGRGGYQTFDLPDLQERIPLGAGKNPDSKTEFHLKDSGGADSIKLSPENLPSHSHKLMASTQKAQSYKIASNLVPAKRSYGGKKRKKIIKNGYNGPMSDTSPDMPEQIGQIVSEGGGALHQNRQPYLALSFCICIDGVYPTKPEEGEAA